MCVILLKLQFHNNLAPEFGSRHLQSFGILQYSFHPGLVLLQQSPPSQLHPALLFSVSHQPSWNHFGDPHPFCDGGVVGEGAGADVVVGGVAVVEPKFGSRHLQSEQKSTHFTTRIEWLFWFRYSLEKKVGEIW